MARIPTSPLISYKYFLWPETSPQLEVKGVRVTQQVEISFLGAPEVCQKVGAQTGAEGGGGEQPAQLLGK